LLAVADMYQAMRETRPHRRPMPASEVAAVLDREVAKGRLDRDAVGAVLQTADDRDRRGRVARHPGGLSDEEIDVLRLVSRGLSDRQVATELGLATGEVHRHLQFAYEKIGVTTRAAAAMFAMRNDLIGGV
jgi:DNA-binding NarL/FixJ family response regulator